MDQKKSPMSTTVIDLDKPPGFFHVGVLHMESGTWCVDIDGSFGRVTVNESTRKEQGLRSGRVPGIR